MARWLELLLVGVVASAATLAATSFRNAQGAGEPVSLLRARGIVLVDRQGRERGHFTLALNGAPHLFMNDANNKLRLVMELAPDGRPTIQLRGADEAEVWSAKP